MKNRKKSYLQLNSDAWTVHKNVRTSENRHERKKNRFFQVDKVGWILNWTSYCNFKIYMIRVYLRVKFADHCFEANTKTITVFSSRMIKHRCTAQTIYEKRNRRESVRAWCLKTIVYFALTDVRIHTTALLIVTINYVNCDIVYVYAKLITLANLDASWCDRCSQSIIARRPLL